MNPKSLANLKRGGIHHRPKGLAEYVRRKTKDGKALVDQMLSIAAGHPVIVKEPDGATVKLKVTVDNVTDAIKWLADRGYGKATQALELSGPDGGPMEHEHVDAAADFTSRMARLAATRGAGGAPS